jgi:hypothetical protein
MPRRSAAALISIARPDGQPDRLFPPASLSQAERVIFIDIVAACSASHFRAQDLPLLTRYVETVALSDHAAKKLRTRSSTGSVGSFGPASNRVVAWRDAACDPLV